jgi:hypothetical protein
MSDWIGSVGVAILLLAFLLNLLNRISKDSASYIYLNIVGSGLACTASWMIDYLPFVVLEGVWMLVSVFALIRSFRKT